MPHVVGLAHEDGGVTVLFRSVPRYRYPTLLHTNAMSVVVSFERVPIVTPSTVRGVVVIATTGCVWLIIEWGFLRTTVRSRFRICVNVTHVYDFRMIAGRLQKVDTKDSITGFIYLFWCINGWKIFIVLSNNRLINACLID